MLYFDIRQLQGGIFMYIPVIYKTLGFSLNFQSVLPASIYFPNSAVCTLDM